MATTALEKRKEGASALRMARLSERGAHYRAGEYDFETLQRFLASNEALTLLISERQFQAGGGFRFDLNAGTLYAPRDLLKVAELVKLAREYEGATASGLHRSLLDLVTSSQEISSERQVSFRRSHHLDGGLKLEQVLTEAGLDLGRALKKG